MAKRTRILLPLLLAVSAAASAQQAIPRPVRWFLSVPALVRVGGAGVVGVAELRARIDPGWHLYSLTQPPGGARATVIAVVGDPPFRLAGTIGRPAPDTIPDANFDMMSEVYDDAVTFRLPLTARAPLPRGPTRVVVAVTYQACTSRRCLTPRTDTVTVIAPFTR